MVAVPVRAPCAQAGGMPGSRAGKPMGDPQPRAANDAPWAVLAWLDTLPPASSAGLPGFPHGGAMVLQLMRRHPGRFDYGAQPAGFVAGDSQPGDEVPARSRFLRTR